MEPKCTFCDYERMKPRIVAETPNFYALPTVGQISDGGHMLVITRKHYVCLGAMEDPLFDEFEEFTGRVESAVARNYKKPMLFEHGILGQSIPHAHLQMMPSDTDMFSAINQDFRVFKQLAAFKDMQALHRSKGVYLFYENLKDEKFGFLLDSYPQYLRIVAAKAIGKPPRGDWRQCTADPENKKLDDLLIEETCRTLRRELG
jgi:diadenosine tetraphosphate (Ap4A) HIT family hydrolase